MPPFHVGFRQECQAVAHYLWATICTPENGKTYFSKAFQAWQYHMSHIHGHIGIEESYMFPAFQAHYKNLDSGFLFADHQKLDGLEKAIGSKF